MLIVLGVGRSGMPHQLRGAYSKARLQHLADRSWKVAIATGLETWTHLGSRMSVSRLSFIDCEERFAFGLKHDPQAATAIMRTYIQRTSCSWLREEDDPRGFHRWMRRREIRARRCADVHRNISDERPTAVDKKVDGRVIHTAEPAEVGV